MVISRPNKVGAILYTLSLIINVKFGMIISYFSSCLLVAVRLSHGAIHKFSANVMWWVTLN